MFKTDMRYLFKLNEWWINDYMSDALADGRKGLESNNIDNFNREGFTHRGRDSYLSSTVISTLEIFRDTN